MCICTMYICAQYMQTHISKNQLLKCKMTSNFSCRNKVLQFKDWIRMENQSPGLENVKCLLHYFHFGRREDIEHLAGNFCRCRGF